MPEATLIDRVNEIAFNAPFPTMPRDEDPDCAAAFGRRHGAGLGAMSSFDIIGALLDGTLQ